MAAYTVIVVDHSNAGIYRLVSIAAPLRKLGELANPDGHRHERDLGSSAPGRVMGWGGVRHAYSPRHSRLEHSTERFVRAVIAAAERPVPGRAGREVLLVAAPELRGVFRRLVPRAWQVTDLPCNLARLPPTALRARIAGFLRAAHK
jgi:protein required for attachment to host cells